MWICAAFLKVGRKLIDLKNSLDFLFSLSLYLDYYLLQRNYTLHVCFGHRTKANWFEEFPWLFVFAKFVPWLLSSAEKLYLACVLWPVSSASLILFRSFLFLAIKWKPVNKRSKTFGSLKYLISFPKFRSR